MHWTIDRLTGHLDLINRRPTPIVHSTNRIDENRRTYAQVLEEREREGQLLAQRRAKRPDLLQRIQVRCSQNKIGLVAASEGPG